MCLEGLRNWFHARSSHHAKPCAGFARKPQSDRRSDAVRTAFVAARYLIGIDLGTTNSAVAYVDTAAADPRVRVFEVPLHVRVSADLFGELKGLLGPRCLLPLADLIA